MRAALRSLAALLLLALVLRAVAMTQKEVSDEIAATMALPNAATASFSIEAAIFDRNSHSTPKIFYSHNEGKLHRAASNTKLFTSIAAFLTLPSSYKMTTVFEGYVDGFGHVEKLIVYGAGDPTFTSQNLTVMAQRLVSKGVKTIDSIVYSDAYFKGELPGTWEWDDVNYDYGSRATGLMLNQNAVTFSVVAKSNQGVLINGTPADLAYLEPILVNNVIVAPPGSPISLDASYQFGRNHSVKLVVSGSMPLDTAPQYITVSALDPVGLFDAHFLRSLTDAGIKVGVSRPLYEGTSFALAVYSPPLYSILNTCLQDSNNLFAETLLRHTGRYESLPGTNEVTLGIKRVYEIAAKFGLDSSEFLQIDGSGLGRNSLFSARAIRKMLWGFWQTSNSSQFIPFLPVAGVSGTLANRFKGTVAERILHAKTGTLSGVLALSGFILPTNTSMASVFSIIFEGSALSSSMTRPLVDAIAVTLTKYTLNPQ